MDASALGGGSRACDVASSGAGARRSMALWEDSAPEPWRRRADKSARDWAGPSAAGAAGAKSEPSESAPVLLGDGDLCGERAAGRCFREDPGRRLGEGGGAGGLPPHRIASEPGATLQRPDHSIGPVEEDFALISMRQGVH